MFRCAFIIFMPYVLTPFPYIATHIIQPKFVIAFLANSVSCSIRVKCAPSNFKHLITPCIFEALTKRATPRCVFPFSFARQTILFPCFFIEIFDKLLCVIPTHTIYWQVITYKTRGILSHDSLPLRLRHGVLTKKEVPYNYIMNRLFIIPKKKDIIFIDYITH